MSFNREQYERLVEMARDLVAMDGGEDLDNIAKELFEMAQDVIGQQSPSLFNETTL